MSEEKNKHFIVFYLILMNFVYLIRLFLLSISISISTTIKEIFFSTFHNIRFIFNYFIN